VDLGLDRFVAAQQHVYSQVVLELQKGAKTGHWMWFVFPQISGLGQSETARSYALSSLEEARAYLDHPILGARLRECTGLVNDISGKSLQQIFGHVDALKFRSSMTLFCQATPDNEPFQRALDKYCDGRLDELTLKILQRPGPLK
jgi:uncharacterized protein (DUF1810 family)